MKIFKLTRTDWQIGDYDGYDSIIVAAVDADDAKQIAPNGMPFNPRKLDRTWTTDIENIEALECGEANADIQRGVISTSFNAG